MEQYIIKGGNPLVGEVEIGGAKNAALAILAAAIMTDETVTIDNLPDVNDINVLLEAISGIGAEVDRIDRHTVRINGSNIENFDIENITNKVKFEFTNKSKAEFTLPSKDVKTMVIKLPDLKSDFITLVSPKIEIRHDHRGIYPNLLSIKYSKMEVDKKI